MNKEIIDKYVNNDHLVLEGGSEKPIAPEGLEEFAREFGHKADTVGVGGEDYEDDIEIAVKAGAEWAFRQGASFDTTVGWIDGKTIMDWPEDITDSFELGDKVIVQIRKR